MTDDLNEDNTAKLSLYEALYTEQVVVAVNLFPITAVI